MLVGQFHLDVIENERDGRSAIKLVIPATWVVRSGAASVTRWRMASARINFPATVERLEVSFVAQDTVGVLSEKIAIVLCRSDPRHSRMSHASNSPPISRSEFVREPLGFVTDVSWFLISGGHCNRQTVGV